MDDDTPPDRSSRERAALEHMVDLQRSAVASMVEGLDDDLARRRLVPSLTTPLGLVKHLTFVERVWFAARLGGRSREELGLPTEVDDSFVLGPDDTIASLLADHAAACEESRRIAADLPLGFTVEHPAYGSIDLHWIYVHMIREVARHLGHGDILREQLLAAGSSQSGSES